MVFQINHIRKIENSYKIYVYGPSRKLKNNFTIENHTQRSWVLTVTFGKIITTRVRTYFIFSALKNNNKLFFKYKTNLQTINIQRNNLRTIKISINMLQQSTICLNYKTNLIFRNK